MEIVFDLVIPVLRILDIAKADEFYLGFLGFKVDWIIALTGALRSIARSRAAASSCT